MARQIEVLPVLRELEVLEGQLAGLWNTSPGIKVLPVT